MRDNPHMCPVLPSPKEYELLKPNWDYNMITPGLLQFHRLYTEKECEEIRDTYFYVLENRVDSMGRVSFGEDSSKYGEAKGHKVCYLHKKNAFQTRNPDILKKLISVTSFMNDRHKKPLVDTMINTIEYIRYKKGDWLGWHTDLRGSELTTVSMLSEQSEYEGGTFQVKDKDDVVVDLDFKQGDMIIFLSKKIEHRIKPMKDGRRRVMVIEIGNADDLCRSGSSSDSDSSSDSSSSKPKNCRKSKKRRSSSKKRSRS